MKIYNVHERRLNTTADSVGILIDSLGGEDDQLWPWDAWPPMKFDSPLKEGARGGHGPVRYRISEYVPGRRIEFMFDTSGLTEGLDGRHLFEIVCRSEYLVLRHIVDAECDFKSWMKWHVLVGPMHDALLEDSLDRAEKKLHGKLSTKAVWSPWVRFLRWGMARKRRRSAVQ